MIILLGNCPEELISLDNTPFFKNFCFMITVYQPKKASVGQYNVNTTWSRRVRKPLWRKLYKICSASRRLRFFFKLVNEGVTWPMFFFRILTEAMFHHTGEPIGQEKGLQSFWFFQVSCLPPTVATILPMFFLSYFAPKTCSAIIGQKFTRMFFFQICSPPQECWSAIFSVLAPITSIITFKTTLVIFFATSSSSSRRSAPTRFANLPGKNSCQKTSYVLIEYDLEKNCFWKFDFPKNHVLFFLILSRFGRKIDSPGTSYSLACELRI